MFIWFVVVRPCITDTLINTHVIEDDPSLYADKMCTVSVIYFLIDLFIYFVVLAVSSSVKQATFGLCFKIPKFAECNQEKPLENILDDNEF